MKRKGRKAKGQKKGSGICDMPYEDSDGCLNPREKNKQFHMVKQHPMGMECFNIESKIVFLKLKTQKVNLSS